MRILCVALAAAAILSRPALADVSLLLEEPIHLLGRLTSTGHATLWLEDICSEDYIHLHPCRAGEEGVVLSRYDGAAGYDWLAVPVTPYLYAVKPGTSSHDIAGPAEIEGLRTSYRAENPNSLNVELQDSTWQAMLGASYRRTILRVHLRTTPEEDDRLLKWLSNRDNRSHFNLFWNNCADFTGDVLNVLFPQAVHRNIVWDAAVMTPEQVASSMSRYAVRHPEVGLAVTVLPQVPGSLARSGRMYGTTESFVKTKPYLLPLAVLNPLEFGLVIASGLSDRRFDVQEHIKTSPQWHPPAESSASAGVASSEKGGPRLWDDERPEGRPPAE